MPSPTLIPLNRSEHMYWAGEGHLGPINQPYILRFDQAVDAALVRRNAPTVNATWGDDTALIVGDYLFAKAYALAAVLPKPEVIAMVEKCAATRPVLKEAVAA